MNLKKSLVSFVGAAALMTSMLAPVMAADTTSDDATSNVTVNEGGSFNFNLWSSSITFNVATISSPTGQTVAMSGDNHAVLFIEDSRTSSPGYKLQMSATNLTSGSTYFIEAANLSVRHSGGGVHSSCRWSGSPAPVGGNSFQTHTLHLGSSYVPLSSGVDLISASDGRGCDWGSGGFQENYSWQLHVPAGTATGVYSGDVTVSSVAEVGDPD